MTPVKHRLSVCVVCVLSVALFLHGAIANSPKKQGEHSRVNSNQATKETTRNGKSRGTPVTAPQKQTLTFACVEEDTECTKDKYGYEAISRLHSLIDDDHNGNVDQLESDEFLRDELQYTDGFERHSLFHNNDKLISVDDLWRAWKFSTVYNWTVDDVVDWLQKEVDLPQYSNIFMDNAVTGSFLPRLASSNNTFLTTVLGIKNPVHKQKVALKAMDTVLFGAPPRRHSYVKDLVLVVLLMVATGGSWFAYLHHRYSQEQVNSMMRQMEKLKKVQEDLERIQDVEIKTPTPLSRTPPVYPEFKEGTAVPQADPPLGYERGGGEHNRKMLQQLEATQFALQQAELQLESSSSWSPPAELQAWLQLTHELEQLHYNAKRQAAERQFQSAKDVCDKIKKRNKAFFGSLRMAHSNSLDEVDQRILNAKVAFEEVKQDLQERLFRWHTMEQICGFAICTNPGLAALQHLLHGARDGNTNGRAAANPVMANMSLDEGDEDLPPAGFASMPPSMSSSKFVRQRGMGSTGSLSHLSRSSVNTGYNAAHPSMANMQRGLSHDTDSPTTNPLNSVSFHLGDQPQDRSLTSTYASLPLGNHSRVKPGLNSLPSSHSMQAGYPGHHPHHPAMQAGNTALTSTSAGYLPARNGGPADDSDDNLSQATLDSLPCSQTSSVVTRGRLRVGNNSGLDLVSHTSLNDSDPRLLSPHARLEKKPSKRKKILSMFRKNPKKPV